MRAIPIACVLALAALSLAACKGEPTPPPRVVAPAAAPVEAKKDDAKPMPPAAPTAAPAEGVKK